MFTEKYPYTDFNEYNLDWVITHMKTVIEEWASTKQEWHDIETEFTDLKNYVHDYFDNLDVQEEIDNKLDEMAADGTLISLIIPYMPVITPQMYGAAGDGITDDTDAIRASIAAAIAEDKVIIFPQADYAVTDTIDIDESINIDFLNSTIVYMGASQITDLIKYHFDTNQSFKHHNSIRNLNINGNSKVDNCLHITSGKGIILNNIYISNPVSYGLLVDQTDGNVWEMHAADITVNAKNNLNVQADSAISILCTDSFFTNIIAVNGSDSWMTFSGNACQIINFHGYTYPDTLTVDKGLIVSGSGNHFENTVIDTFNTVGIYISAPFNAFYNTMIAKPAANTCIGFDDHTDYTVIDGVMCSDPVTLIKSTTAQALTVKNITTYGNMVKDIELTQNKLPYHFTYDYSGRAVTPIKNSINTWSMLDTSTFNLTNCSFGSNPMFRKFNGYMHISCTLTVTNASDFQVKTATALPATQYLIAYNLTQGNSLLLVIWADGSIHYNNGTLANNNVIVIDSTIATNL